MRVGAGHRFRAEGAALAIALLRHCRRARATLATTHFGELKALINGDPASRTPRWGFLISRLLSPTYHLQWGIPGRSNALRSPRRWLSAT